MPEPKSVFINMEIRYNDKNILVVQLDELAILQARNLLQARDTIEKYVLMDSKVSAFKYSKSCVPLPIFKSLILLHYSSNHARREWSEVSKPPPMNISIHRREALAFFMPVGRSVTFDDDLKHPQAVKVTVCRN